MTLREPPKVPRTANIIGRIVGVLLLLAVFALVIWTAVTNQQAAAIQRSDPEVHAPGERVFAGGGLFHVDSRGSGEPVTVLIHYDTIAGGAPLRPLAEQLADATGGRVIVPDLVGFGFSSRPDGPGRGSSTVGLTESLTDLLEELELSSVRLVGFGWGGEVAAELAVTSPELVSTLFLVDTPDLPTEPSGWHTLAGLPLGVGEAVAYMREGAAAGAEVRFVTECPSWADCTSPEAAEAYRRTSEAPGTAQAIWARRSSERATVAASRLDQIEAGTVVISVDTPAEQGENLARRFPEADSIQTTPDGLVDVLSG